MSKRSIILIFVLLFISLGTLMAVEAELQAPREVKKSSSVFDIGILNKIPYSVISKGEFTNYMPGIRLQWNILSWIGMAADAMVYSYDLDNQNYDLIFDFTAIVRAPLGLVEPYFGIGSSSGLRIIGSSVSSDFYRVHIKTGVDFNILTWLGLGIEGTLWTPDPAFFFENMTGELLLDHLDVGINVKFRF